MYENFEDNRRALTTWRSQPVAGEAHLIAAKILSVKAEGGG